METPAARTQRILSDSAVRGADWAAEELLPLLYDELRALAGRRMAGEPLSSTLQATALVHEAWLRLAGDGDPGWSGRGHFYGAAAQAMRRILVERARARGRVKRGGGGERITLDEVAAPAPGSAYDVLALDEALERLRAHDPRKERVVCLRHFAGLELGEIALALGVSLGTAKSDWAYARAWLHRELERGAGAEPAAGAP